MTEYDPGRGPGPAPISEDDLLRILGGQRFAVLATNKGNGHRHRRPGGAAGSGGAG
ncbi:Uncharacterised protein [Mycobacterium tuberculosis]|nr:Uncharacterised protein [Mycobacterium tuberculosis]